MDQRRPTPPSSAIDRRRDVKATVSDEQSELQKEDIRLFVDGKEKSSFTYNPKNDRLVFDKMEQFGVGKHKAKIKATDEAGNTAKRKWTFRFR